MEYHINVALRGQHVFDAECRGASAARAFDIFRDMCERYPKSEGYTLTLKRWINSGTVLAEEA